MTFVAEVRKLVAKLERPDSWDTRGDGDFAQAVACELEAIADQLEAFAARQEEAIRQLTKENEDLHARMFPVQDGPAIPWRVIGPFDKLAQHQHGGQNLEKLAQRGGLSPCEVVSILDGAGDFYKYWNDTPGRDMRDKSAAIRTMLRLVQEIGALQSSPLKAENSRLRAEIRSLRGIPHEGEKMQHELLATLKWAMRHLRSHVSFGGDGDAYARLDGAELIGFVTRWNKAEATIAKAEATIAKAR